MATTLVRIQLLSKTSTDFATANPVLLDGEFGVANAGSSVPVLKIGDGVRPWSALPDIVAAGAGADYVAGPVNTLPAGSPAEVIIDNSVSPPTISFSIPEGGQGDEGPSGPANTLTIGSVVTVPPGSPANASITGTAPDQVLNLWIPSGLPGSMALADPTGLIGLVAVPGVSLLGTRSDATQALSQAIVPTWTGKHFFAGGDTVSVALAGVGIGARGGVNPIATWVSPSSAANEKLWRMLVSGPAFTFQSVDDAYTTVRAAWAIGRAGVAISSLSFGNATDNPTYAFLGTGAASSANPWTLAGPHTFTNDNGVSALIVLNQSAAAVDQKNTMLRTSSGGGFVVGSSTDAAPTVSVTNIIDARRVGAAWSTLSFGNATNNPTYSFLGTGATTFTGTIIKKDIAGTASAMNTYMTFHDGANTQRGFIGYALGNTTFSIVNAIGPVAVVAPSMTLNGVPVITLDASPVWSGQHLFAGQAVTATGTTGISLGTRASLPVIEILNSTGAADAKRWELIDLGGLLSLRTLNDGATIGRAFLEATRVGVAITNITVGNNTDNNTFTFAGTGIVTSNGKIVAPYVQLGATGSVSAALVTAVNSPSNNSYEWGHNNPAGYRHTLGNMASGRGFLAFHAEHGTTAATYRTRGVLGSVIESDGAGAVAFRRIANANADNQVAAASDLTWSATGVFTFANTVLVGTGTTTQAFGINGPAASNREFYYLTNGSVRWTMRVDAAAESGSNSGSNFVILPIGDTGAGLTAAITINRATSNVAIGAALNVAGLITGTTPTQAFGTNNTSLASTAFVQAAIPSSAPRVWTVIPYTVSGTVLTNSSGRDLPVNVTVALNSTGLVNCYIGGTIIATCAVSGSASTQDTLSFIVPPGASWQVTWSGAVTALTVYGLM